MKVRPILYCSRCLEFDHCRYDGSIISSEIVRNLMDHAEIVHDCPEMGIGLGTPRPPVKIYEDKEGFHLYQPSTEMDHTEDMKSFVDGILNSLGPVDGFILKARSPSCGLNDVKIYGSREKGKHKKLGSGFLGMEVQNRFFDLAVETEKRLLDDRIRDHFLTKLYCLARYRVVMEENSAKSLIDFHSMSKFTLMAYNQSLMREMGRVVSQQKELGIEAALVRYRALLGRALSKGPSYNSHINVLMHCFGFVSTKLGKEERSFFLDSLDLYRDERVPLISLKTMLRSWLIRFDVDYLLDQYYFEPYPEELMRQLDTKKDRELWR